SDRAWTGERRVIILQVVQTNPLIADVCDRQDGLRYLSLQTEVPVLVVGISQVAIQSGKRKTRNPKACWKGVCQRKLRRANARNKRIAVGERRVAAHTERRNEICGIEENAISAEYDCIAAGTNRISKFVPGAEIFPIFSRP